MTGGLTAVIDVVETSYLYVRINWTTTLRGSRIALVIQELQVPDAFGPVRSRGRHAYARPTFGY